MNILKKCLETGIMFLECTSPVIIPVITVFGVKYIALRITISGNTMPFSNSMLYTVVHKTLHNLINCPSGFHVRCL